MRTLSIALLSTMLSAPAALAQTELTGHIGRPDISPDGNRITFLYTPDEETLAREIYVADIDGTNVRQLTEWPEVRIKKGPVWSPDGQRIAFHADVDGGAQIFTIHADGTDLTRITKLPGYNVEPYWSPDGQQLVFNAIPPDERVQMYVVRLDGSDPQPLSNPKADNWYPRLTPSEEILFTSNQDHDDFYHIYLMQPDGSELRKLTKVDAINWFPEVSLDGSQIVFHSNRDDPGLSPSGNYNLYLMDMDGRNLRRLTDLPGQELHPKWFPSGEKILFEWHHEGAKGIHVLDVKTRKMEKIRLRR